MAALITGGWRMNNGRARLWDCTARAAIVTLVTALFALCATAISCGRTPPQSAALTTLPAFGVARTPPPSWSAPTGVSVCHPPSMAHCYTEATMESYVDAIIPMVDQFFSASYARMPKPAGYVFVADNYPTTEACQDEHGSEKATSAGAFEYCAADHKVYLGQTASWNFFNDDVPAGAVAWPTSGAITCRRKSVFPSHAHLRRAATTKTRPTVWPARG